MSQDQILRCIECNTPFVRIADEPDGGAALPQRCPMCQRLAPAPGRQRGLVKWFGRGRGYGFITSLTGSEVFVHRASLAAGHALLRAGQLVEFRVEHSARGAQAVGVMVLADS